MEKRRHSQLFFVFFVDFVVTTTHTKMNRRIGLVIGAWLFA